MIVHGKNDKVFIFTMMIIGIVIAVSGLMIPPVSAQNMTITNLDLIGKQTVLLYSSSGVLLGTYNTSSNVIDLPTTDFQLILKPNAITRFMNPTLFLGDIIAGLETYWIQIFMIGGLLIMLMILADYGRGRRH